MGCHFLLQCVRVKSESEVAQSCLTLSNPMDCSLPGSSVGFSRQEYWSGVPLPSPLLTTTCTVFHSWLMVTTSCSQMLHQHLMYTHCDFLQNKKGSAHIQIAEEWGCYSSRLPFPFDFLDSVLTPLSRYPLQKTFFVSSPTSCQDPSMSYS